MQRGFGSNSVDDLQAKQTFLERRKMRKNATYTVFFFITLGLAFTIHLQSLPNAKFFLIQSYSINAVLALAALLLLGFGMEKKKNNLANLYLITVAIKLIVYFLFFHPQFKLDGTVNRSEFFMFFIPYALGLLAEIILLARRFT